MNKLKNDGLTLTDFFDLNAIFIQRDWNNLTTMMSSYIFASALIAAANAASITQYASYGGASYSAPAAYSNYGGAGYAQSA